MIFPEGSFPHPRLIFKKAQFCSEMTCLKKKQTFESLQETPGKMKTVPKSPSVTQTNIWHDFEQLDKR